jgi:hypothetical protein
LPSILPRLGARSQRSQRRAGQPILTLATAPKLSLVQSLRMRAEPLTMAGVRRDPPSARSRARA